MTDIAGIDVARIEIRLPEFSVHTKAGVTLENPVTLVNLTPLPDFFYLAASGIPAPWATFDKESVNLFPNWSDIINLTIAVPEDTQPGSYFLEIEASSRSQDNINTSIRLELIVGSQHPAPFIHPEPQQNLHSGHISDFTPNLPDHFDQNQSYSQPGMPPPFMPSPIEFPRLQLDLEFGQLAVPGGQTAEQVVHLLNLGAQPHNFSIGLEGLPPEWITIQPPVLHLSPNWSEPAYLKIAVPADAVPGRYLIGVKAVPEHQPEATVWRQFDMVILPPLFAAPPLQPAAPEEIAALSVPQPPTVEHPVVAPLAERVAPTPAPGVVPAPALQPEIPVQHFAPETPGIETQLPAASFNQTPSTAPAVENPHTEQFQSSPQQPTGWPQQQFMPGPVPAFAPEAATARADKKKGNGLFGWGKKKAEPVLPEPILFVPIAPAEQSLPRPTPVVEALPPAPEQPTLPTIEPVAALPAAAPKTVEAEEISDPISAQDAPTVTFSTETLRISNLETPVKVERPLEPEVIRPVVVESIDVPPATTETVLLPTPSTPIEPGNQTGPVIAAETPATAEPVQETAAAGQDDTPTSASTQSWMDIFYPNGPITAKTPESVAPVEEIEPEVNPAIDDEITRPHLNVTRPSARSAPANESAPVEPITIQPSVVARLDAGPAVAEQSAPIEEIAPVTGVPAEETAPGPPLVPAKIKTENFELTVENVKIRFELGTSAEQQIGLVNLMGNPAFFNLKVEGLPETWYNFSYSQINLFPNWKEEVYLRLEATTDTAPGIFPASLTVSSPNLPDEKIEVPLEIEVLASAVLADKLYRATGSGQPVKLPADARVEMLVDTANLSLRPEENLEQNVKLINYAPIPDFFELKLEGLLDSWYQLSTPAINLFPNWNEEFYLRVALPDSATPGLYPVRLLVKGQNYPELHAEQSLLLQVLPALPKPVVVPEPDEDEESINPALGDAETVTFNRAAVSSAIAIEEDEEETDSEPSSPFSFASFFQQQNLVPGASAYNPATTATPAQAAPLPFVPANTEPVYNQPTTAFNAGVPASASYGSNVPAGNDGAAPANPFEKRPTVKMGQQSVLAPQTSLAGIIPIISEQAPAPAPVQEFVRSEPLAPVAPPRKRSLWQRITGQGKEKQSAPVTPKIDENVLWRSAPGQPQGQTPKAQAQAQKAQQKAQTPAKNSASTAGQATQVNRPVSGGNQAIPAGDYTAVLSNPQPAAAAPARSYAPMSTGGDVARVQITLEKPHVTIVAGDSATQQVFLMNLTSLPDNFDLSIEGMPANWFSFETSTLNLFPNWNEHTALTLTISDKVKPDLYKGKIVVSATAQTGVRAVMPIEIQVLAPLVVQARLMPHRGKGYKARYEMLLRNRSMTQGLMTMQWDLANSYSVGTFDPPQLVLGPGQTQSVKLQVMLRKKTPSDQARQMQPFRALVQPQWTVAQSQVNTAPVGVEGEFVHRSRWVFIQRHPFLLTFLTLILIIVLLWNLLILPFIQNTLMAFSIDNVNYKDVAAKTLSVDQITFNIRLKENNPVGAFFPTNVAFQEGQSQGQKGTVIIRTQPFVFTQTISGSLNVDPVSGDLQFVATNKNDLGSFPWIFIPPDKVVHNLSIKIKNWLKTQSPPERMDDVYIEGNTIFLKLRACQTGEVACK